MSHSFFTCLWPLFLSLLFVIYLVEKPSIPREIPTAWSETNLVVHLCSRIFILTLLFSLIICFLVKIRSIIKKLFVILEIIFNWITRSKGLSSLGQIYIQLLFSLNFWVIIRVFSVLKGFGPFVLKGG